MKDVLSILLFIVLFFMAVCQIGGIVTLFSAGSAFFAIGQIVALGFLTAFIVPKLNVWFGSKLK